MASRKIFYDPTNPRFLTDAEINALSPSECAEACSQLQQNITSCLQRIDTSFVNTHRMMVEQLLPMVEEYGQHSRQIWDGMRFWKTFFEVSANIRMGGATYQDPDSTFDTTQSSLTINRDHSQDERDSTLRQEDFYDEEPSPPSEVRAENTNQPWNDRLSPYDALQKDMESVLESSKESHTFSAQMRAQKDSLANMLKDLSVESSSKRMPEVPVLETSNISSVPSLQGHPSLSFLSLESQASTSDVFNSKNIAMLHDLNAGNAMSSTPAKGHLPPDIPQSWNGLADLRMMPLTAFESPNKAVKGKARAKGKELMSPPIVDLGLTPGRLTKTPSKEVAQQLMQQEIFDAYGINLDDSIELPSALKDPTWETRYGGFNDLATSPSKRAMGGTKHNSAGSPMHHLTLSDGDDDEYSRDGDDIFDPLEAPRLSFTEEKKLDHFSVCEGQQRPSQFFVDEGSINFNDEIDENSFEDTETSGIILDVEPGEESFEGDNSQESEEHAPEGTIYMQDTEGGTAFFAGGPEGTNNFHLMGPGAEDMGTYHGGRLVDSKPYIDSPLAAYKRG